MLSTLGTRPFIYNLTSIIFFLLGGDASNYGVGGCYLLMAPEN
jgi:hypothetical protein